jgi:hypothetical protein
MRFEVYATITIPVESLAPWSKLAPPTLMVTMARIAAVTCAALAALMVLDASLVGLRSRAPLAQVAVYALQGAMLAAAIAFF